MLKKRQTTSPIRRRLFSGVKTSRWGASAGWRGTFVSLQRWRRGQAAGCLLPFKPSFRGCCATFEGGQVCSAGDAGDRLHLFLEVFYLFWSIFNFLRISRNTSPAPPAPA